LAPLLQVNEGALILGDPRGGSLILDGNHNSYAIITVDGTVSRDGELIMNDSTELCNNDLYAVKLNAYSNFTMNGGSIHDNVNSTTDPGGGVLVNNADASFTMRGGAIHTNTYSGTSAGGGGVGVLYGKFFMEGGSVSGNSAFPTTAGGGGGVYVYGGEFTMHDGSVSRNTLTTASLGATGGGVYASSGTINMYGGDISHNDAICNSYSMSGGYGGGVYVGGTFNMYGGVISYNTVSATRLTGQARGGGVFVLSTFNMHEGIISNNTASATTGNAQGGGVYVYRTFNMNAGLIAGNTVSASGSTQGGGVYMDDHTSTPLAIFTMSGSALVDTSPGNEVYLPATKLITITGDLEHSPAANITLPSYSSRTVLTDDPPGSWLTGNHSKFLVNGAVGKIDGNGDYTP
jgi:hypothetical protein